MKLYQYRSTNCQKYVTYIFHLTGKMVYECYEGEDLNKNELEYRKESCSS
jgi:hypothetical protein